MHPARRDSFVEFASGVGEHPGQDGHLERIDNDGDYSRQREVGHQEGTGQKHFAAFAYATRQERTLPEWCDLLGVNLRRRTVGQIQR